MEFWTQKFLILYFKDNLLHLQKNNTHNFILFKLLRERKKKRESLWMYLKQVTEENWFRSE